MGHAHPHPTPRSLHPREVHQRTIVRQAAHQRVFRKIPEGPIPDRDRKLARASVQEYRVHHEAVAGAAEVGSLTMKFTTDRPLADTDQAARKLVEIANASEAVQEGRIYIELVNGPFLPPGGTPNEYRAGIERAIGKGWLLLHESGSYVKFTQASADPFA